MAENYSRDLAKVAVAKILQTIGWHSINTTPIEILTDVLGRYITQLGRAATEYANEFGFAEPNLDHLGLVFRDFHVNLADLEEYCTYVNFGQTATPVPKYPLSKEDHLNFLKPGSKEVVTRPVHIHEHLPPMYPLLEATENEVEDIIKPDEPDEQVANENSSPVFKKPADIASSDTFRRPRLVMEEEGRPTREISSVMMTTSGFLSPAREGKLPESRTPLATIDSAPPNNPPPPPPPPPLVNDPVKKPVNKVIKKIEKKKERIGKELFRPDERLKKVTTMKGILKLKQMKAAANAALGTNVPPTQNPSSNNTVFGNELKISPIVNNKLLHHNTKINKALVAARQKTEKLNTTITPIPMKVSPTPQMSGDNVDKLFTEPDKKKVNILKKISNVKNEKPENKIIKIKEEKPDSRESSPGLIINDKVDTPPKVPHISDDITIELVPCPPANNAASEKVDRAYFDESPPGTPSTPKTPEMISQSPPLPREKRKRKDKSRIKKVHKLSPARIDSDDIIDIIVDRPKTPEAQVMLKQDLPMLPNNPPPQMAFPFIRNFGPGLIPPLNNPLYQSLPFPQFMHGFGQNPYMPSPHLPPFLSATRQEELPPKIPEKPPTPVCIDEDVQHQHQQQHHHHQEQQQEQQQHHHHQQQQQQQPQLPQQHQQQQQFKTEKKIKEHKKEKKDKIKKKNKKDKIKNKAEKKKLKEERREKIKKEKKEKRKDKELSGEGCENALPKLMLKLGSASPCAESIQDTKKLNIKPIVKKEEEESAHPSAEIKRELSPELAKISALVTGQPKPKVTTLTPPSNFKEDAVKEDTAVPVQSSVLKAVPGPGRPCVLPIKPKPAKTAKQQIPVKDAEGNEVWICPACGKQDDGSPMIGCDDCDAWYHWVCVNIQVAPADNEDWYCRLCIVKKQEALQSDKKKKRKKKEKKEH